MFPFHIVFGDRLPRALEVRKHELISQIRRVPPNEWLRRITVGCLPR